MQQPLPTLAAPTFYLTARQPLRPASILLATVAAAAALSSVLFALGHSGHAHLAGNTSAARSAAPASHTPDTPDNKDDKDDDPNQIDTIVLGDPADAPAPARPGNHVSPVHATVIVRLPRFGPDVGLIPDTPAGRLLYTWLAAFNRANDPALANVLHSDAPATASQLELRHQTGGFTLLSAKEVAPGVLVFRLRDQTPAATEVLGTLQLRTDSSPATISTFSLRAVPSPQPGPTGAASPPPATSPR